MVKGYKEARSPNPWANKTPTTDAKPKKKKNRTGAAQTHKHTHFTHPSVDLITLQNHNNVTLFFSLLLTLNLCPFVKKKTNSPVLKQSSPINICSISAALLLAYLGEDVGALL